MKKSPQPFTASRKIITAHDKVILNSPSEKTIIYVISAQLPIKVLVKFANLQGQWIKGQINSGKIKQELRNNSYFKFE